MFSVISFLCLTIFLTSSVMGTEKVLYFSVYFLKPLISFSNCFVSFFYDKMMYIVRYIVEIHMNFYGYTMWSTSVFTNKMIMVPHVAILFIISVPMYICFFGKCSRYLPFHTIPPVSLLMVFLFFNIICLEYVITITNDNVTM